MLAMVVSGLLAALPGTGVAQDLWPTPEISEITELEAGDALAFGMRAELGDTGIYLGIGLVCTAGGGGETAATVFFGGFPWNRRPVQLGVRGPDGRVEHFGQVVSGGRDSGFHSPQMVEPAEAARFADVALRPGVLVSNGFRSFWNRVGKERNRQVREAFTDCLNSGGDR